MHKPKTLPANPKKGDAIIVIRPFVANIEVLSAIRPMHKEDIPRVAHLHKAAMGNSLWGTLGERFLRNIYRGMLSSPLFLGFVYEQNGQIEGFIAGSEDLPAMMKSVALSSGHRLLISAVLGITNKDTLTKLLRTAQYFRASTEELGQDIKAESMFCSFTPQTRGKKISGHINKVLFETLLARGHQHIKITTETDNVGANRQLKSWGFQDQGHFHFYGKEMICYTLNLSTSPRLTTKDWTNT